MKFDYLIVGAGFCGAVLAERLASQLDKRVLLIDRRDHIAGNAFDYLDENGLRIHRYGPHIFHTNSQRVANYLSAFTKWHPYEHRVLAQLDRQLVPVPFNLTSIRACFPAASADKIISTLMNVHGEGARVPVLKLRQSTNPALRELGEFVYEKVFLHYTVKQWGLDPEQLSPSVTARVPIVVSEDDRYFNDTHQAMPADGYTEMFRKMLNHPNINLLLNTDYETIRGEVETTRTIFSGPLDTYFSHRFGPLPYRSLRFETALGPGQPVATINYPNDFEYTRSTEWRHFMASPPSASLATKEFPQAHEHGVNEPYYPIPRDENRTLFEKYRALADALKPNVWFAGRLGDYQYYNMDQVVARALALFEKELAPLG